MRQVSQASIFTKLGEPQRGQGLAGTPSAREQDGAIVLGAVLVIMILVGSAQWLLSVRAADRALPLPRRAGLLAARDGKGHPRHGRFCPRAGGR